MLYYSVAALVFVIRHVTDWQYVGLACIWLQNA